MAAPDELFCWEGDWGLPSVDTDCLVVLVSVPSVPDRTGSAAVWWSHSHTVTRVKAAATVSMLMAPRSDGVRTLVPVNPSENDQLRFHQSDPR